MGCGLCGSVLSGLVIGITSIGSFALILLGELLMVLINWLKRKRALG